MHKWIEGQSTSSALRGRLLRETGQNELHFTQLRGTRREGVRITKMLREKMPRAQLWLSNKALESGLKAWRSPRIRHLATHGFFLKDQPRDPNQEWRGLGVPDWFGRSPRR